MRKRRLLEEICSGVAEILKDKHIAVDTFIELRKMVPLRQTEAAELMVAMNKYTLSCAKSLLAATPQAQLVEADKPKHVRGLSDEQIALMERESINLEREFREAVIVAGDVRSWGKSGKHLLVAAFFNGIDPERTLRRQF